ncbi:hypothetical protein SAMN06272771_5333 [Streptomyces sp. Ag82_O1-12]|nr:hypothetical protein SAMN06272771_5333 [Streptomyces sp. Ag82_O1-12]SOD47912.1 hypothetical protein SAMN06272727_5335 [Streptomyces sp. Ag82_G6-1]
MALKEISTACPPTPPAGKTAAIGATTALALTACGGGTGSDDDKAAADKPQGVVSQAEARKIADFTDLNSIRIDSDLS